MQYSKVARDAQNFVGSDCPPAHLVVVQLSVNFIVGS